jgi:hypothetical protein
MRVLQEMGGEKIKLPAQPMMNGNEQCAQLANDLSSLSYANK